MRLVLNLFPFKFQMVNHVNYIQVDSSKLLGDPTTHIVIHIIYPKPVIDDEKEI